MSQGLQLPLFLTFNMALFWWPVEASSPPSPTAQVVSIHSGYGRIGAFCSERWHQVYGIDLWKDSEEPAPNRTCSVDTFMAKWNM